MFKYAKVDIVTDSKVSAKKACHLPALLIVPCGSPRQVQKRCSLILGTVFGWTQFARHFVTCCIYVIS